MTRISTIHGIPFNEYADRSANVAAKDYFPYLSMSKGEMELALLRQRAQMYAGFYPEFPVYRQAVAMLDKALKDGDTGVNYIGAVPDDLQGLAATIQTAAKKRQPASRAGTAARVGSVIPLAARFDACVVARSQQRGLLTEEPDPSTYDYLVWEQQAGARSQIFQECKQVMDVEKILNDGLEKFGHHLLYKSFPRNYATPPDVGTKRILHQTGIEGVANVGQMDPELVYMWVENAIMLKNTQIKIGPWNSAYTSVYLAPDPEQALNEYKKWLFGQPVQVREKLQAGIGKIGDPVTVSAIIFAIIGAMKVAFEWLKEIQRTKQLAMVEARGFGTQAFSANQSDWQGSPTTGGALGNDNLLLIGGAAAALYFLSDN